MTILLITTLFYLHLAGQSVDPALTYGVYALWLALGIWAAIRRPRWLLVIVALLLAALALGVLMPWGLRRLLTVLGYIATYQALAIHRLALAPALAVSVIIMSVLAIVGIYLGNPNVVAGFIFLAGMAGLGFADWRRWLVLGVSIAGLVATGSRGSWIAAGVAGLVYVQGWRYLLVVPAMGVALWRIDPWTVADRWQVWQAAARDLTWLGRGFGAAAVYPSLARGLFYHAHCLPLTVAVEVGMPGLAGLGYGLWRLIPRLTQNWQGAAIAGLLAWSLIDEVVWFWGCGMIAVWLVAEVMQFNLEDGNVQSRG